LKDRWARRLEGQRGVRILTPFEQEQSCGLATIGVDGVDSRGLADHLWKHHRIIATPIVHEEFNGLRVTPNVYTTLAEIDTFADAMEAIIKSGRLPA